jgi:ubiquitin carboxyl-terminal hydrolase 9/13
VSIKNKKDEPQLDLTPVEKLLHNAGPIRQDGSDKFFGLENVSVPGSALLSGMEC